MLSQGSWVVVADAAHATIFSAQNEAGDLKELQRLSHPEQRMHTGDLRTGGKGEQQESSGTAVHQADPQTSTMEKHADIFAKELAEKLSTARHHEKFESITLVAAPAFLGRLRDQLDSATEQCVEQTVDKNWAQHDQHEIEKLLRKKPAN